MDPVRQREIASRGGKTAQATGRSHRWTSEEAKEAGRKGGSMHSREHLAEIGRKGGLARQRKAAK
jgi:general stress protein YciG